MDLQPTITPVLDLSEFRKDVAQIDASFDTRRPMDLDVAYSQARSIAMRHARNDMARRTIEERGLAPAGAEVSYTQNNYSPKSLTAAEIYRQTRNQLSTAKGALTP
jgi:hypothetical protein